MGEMEITNKIKIIEQLKSQLLSDVSSVFSNMTAEEGDNKNNIDLLADIMIITYFLSEKLGTSYEGLDLKVKNKLKIALLTEGEHSKWRTQLSLLSRHFDI
ncbi:MAG: hypothetical protein CVU84_06675 [Firmicutes bacterium HGW-Firmicutes-1]|jgi:hypothetical protein|nr:MAG: hypothetical protein CVU84_06675 [Firmicutes bacterium HGW-Firmicutes-1]